MMIMLIIEDNSLNFVYNILVFFSDFDDKKILKIF